MEKETANLLLAVASRINQTADNYHQAKYFFKSKYAEGFAAMAKKEAMERWRLAGKIKNLVAESGAVCIPAKERAGLPMKGVEETVALLCQHDISTQAAIDATAKKLIDTGKVSAAFFLGNIGGEYMQEVNEMHKNLDHMRTDPKLKAMNDSLAGKYEDCDHK